MIVINGNTKICCTENLLFPPPPLKYHLIVFLSVYLNIFFVLLQARVACLT